MYLDPPAPVDDDPPAPRPVIVPALRAAVRWGRGLRRSTVIVGLTAAIVVFAIAAALILVQRVQIDPLQTGATQVARLQKDPGFAVPAYFQGDAVAGEVTGFTGFHGFGVVTGFGGYVSGMGEPQSQCLTVYLETDGAASTTSNFTGPLYTGCAAGTFPATVTLSNQDPNLTEEFASAFSGSEGVQFVYDQANEEVVVFAG